MYYRDKLNSFSYLIIFSEIILTGVPSLAGVPKYNTHISVQRLIVLYVKPVASVANVEKARNRGSRQKVLTCDQYISKDGARASG
jgi:hypothetical protein